MKKLVFIFAAVMVCTLTIHAENNAENSATAIKTTQAVSKRMLSGKVIDPVTNEALAGATITVGGKKVFTDLDGKFTIEEMKGKEYEVTVSMISYRTEKLVVNPQTDLTINVSLKR